MKKFFYIFLAVIVAANVLCLEAQKNKRSDNWKSYGKVKIDSTQYTADSVKAQPEGQNKTAKKIAGIDSSHINRKAKILLESQYRGDSVVLRWAVDKPGGWVTANRLGYVVKRIDLSDNKEELLTMQPLFPWSIEKWKEKSARNNKYAAIAAQCLYGQLTAGDPAKSNSPNDFMQNLKNASIELSNKHGFALFAADMDAHAAMGLALRFVDYKVEKNKRYIYTVETAVQDTSYFVDGAVINISTERETPPATPPSDFRATSLDGALELKWVSDDLNSFTAYNLYRLEENGVDFKKLNINPIVPMMPSDRKLQNSDPDFSSLFTDSNLVNYKEYTYCLKGITSFAEETPCAIVKGMPIDLTAPKAPKLLSKQISRNRLKLYWENKDPEPDLAGYIILKSADFENDYYAIHQEIIAPGIKEIIDSFAVDTEPFYIIYALDTAGNLNRSIPLTAFIVDSLPPSKPEGLTGTIDSLGRVRLEWELGPEDNIKGYRVFWANNRNYEFTQIVPSLVNDTEYSDSISLNTVTSKVYYRVAAVNNRNGVSELSDILELKRPDIIPPQHPVITAFSSVDSVIIIKWEPSSSDDVEKQLVKRREFGHKEWHILDELEADMTGYFDFKGDENTFFEYSIVAVDSAGNSTPSSNIVKVKKLNNKMDEAVENLKAVYDEKKNTVNLSWNLKPKKESDFWISILRSYVPEGSAGGDPVYYDAVDKQKNKYEDYGIIGKGKYKYKVKIASNTGSSKIEREVEVEVK